MGQGWLATECPVSPIPGIFLCPKGRRTILVHHLEAGTALVQKMHHYAHCLALTCCYLIVFNCWHGECKVTGEGKAFDLKS